MTIAEESALQGNTPPKMVSPQTSNVQTVQLVDILQKKEKRLAPTVKVVQFIFFQNLPALRAPIALQDGKRRARVPRVAPPTPSTPSTLTTPMFH